MCTLDIFLVFSTFIATIIAQNSSARSFNSACGQVFTDERFIIESPLYPSNYPLNYQCSYLIKGPTCPTSFTFQFLDFNVEESLGCSKDRLEVDDQDALCGNKNNEIKTYFSEKGALILKFVSDERNTGRGYRILVTRSPCKRETTTNLPKWHTTNNDVEFTPTTKKYFQESKGRCCQSFYKSKQFILTSPNFPYSMSSSTECSYEIHKTNTNICRLRIHVQFFWLGRSSSNCPEGFLEIDGKHFCGCKSDLKIIVPFQGQSTKVLRFVSRGYERSSYSGFIMEVIQDECPKKVEKNLTIEKRFGFDNDEINRVRPSGSHEAAIEKLRLISENTEVVSNDNQLSRKSPQVIRHFYFYSSPEFNRFPRDREETEYVDTSSVSSSIIKDTVDYGYCRNWNQLQFNMLSLSKLPVCRMAQGSTVEEKKCVELKQLRGYFKSPGYPFFYSANTNVCYRFYKSPGYCAIRIYMKDFSLQDDINCQNDYLLFVDKLRYCGRSLWNTVSTLDLRNKPYEQMNFVTDALYCDRGFFGSYEQLPCPETPHPTSPLPPPICSKTIEGRTFTLDIDDNESPMCSYEIIKYGEYVCSVNLYFEKFDLLCTSESLVIDGTMYCGSLTGKTVKINIENKNPVLIYRRSNNIGISGLRLRIRGVQTSDDCPEPEVPAERILKMDSREDVDFENTTQFLVKIDKRFKDICGVITNTTETKLPKTFCDLIKQNDNNVTNCLPLTENSLIVPIESQKLELKIVDVQKTEEIEFKEVDCDKIKDL